MPIINVTKGDYIFAFQHAKMSFHPAPSVHQGDVKFVAGGVRAKLEAEGELPRPAKRMRWAPFSWATAALQLLSWGHFAVESGRRQGLVAGHMAAGLKSTLVTGLSRHM